MHVHGGQPLRWSEGMKMCVLYVCGRKMPKHLLWEFRSTVMHRTSGISHHKAVQKH